MFAYLKAHHRSKLDPRYVEHAPRVRADWSDFYGPVKEVIPSDAPPARGLPVQMTCCVDSNHAGDEVNRRSRTGVLIFCNSSPILWHGKKQTSIETSSFGSEFSAMKTGVELVEGLRYKLRMLGVGLDGPTYVRADNMSVVHNSSNPASQLKKKCHSVAYHYTRERCCSGACCVSFVPSAHNLVDMLTKSQPGDVRRQLTNQVLF